jgi:hypothetical protein
VHDGVQDISLPSGLSPALASSAPLPMQTRALLRRHSRPLQVVERQRYRTGPSPAKSYECPVFPRRPPRTAPALPESTISGSPKATQLPPPCPACSCRASTPRAMLRAPAAGLQLQRAHANVVVPGDLGLSMRSRVCFPHCFRQRCGVEAISDLPPEHTECGPDFNQPQRIALSSAGRALYPTPRGFPTTVCQGVDFSRSTALVIAARRSAGVSFKWLSGRRVSGPSEGPFARLEILPG